MSDTTDIDDPIVAVRVVNPAINESGNKAPERSSWSSFVIPAGLNAFAPIRILSRNERRSKAVIQVFSGLVNNNTTGYVIIGNHNKVRNGMGGFYPVGAVIEYTGEQEVWMTADPAFDSLTVSVLDEWDLET